MTVWEKLFGRRDLPKQKVEEGEGSRDSSHQAPVENDSSCQEYPEIVNPKDGAKMVFVPAGGFLMGSSTGDGDARLDEKPQHEVYLDGYWIYKYPVTVGQYREFSQATGRIMPDAPFSEWTDSHPVMQNDWDEAKAYCDWAGVFLPTEAQWKKLRAEPPGVSTHGVIDGIRRNVRTVKTQMDVTVSQGPGQLEALQTEPVRTAPWTWSVIFGNGAPTGI